MRRKPVYGAPDLTYISTAYIERQNLNMRMSMRRFTRLTYAFSKKAVNLQRSLALYFMHYNFVRKHQTLGTTPAIAHGLTDRSWTLGEPARPYAGRSSGLAYLAKWGPIARSSPITAIPIVTTSETIHVNIFT